MQPNDSFVAAARFGNAVAVQNYLESGADANTSVGNHGLTPLIVAIHEGHLEIVQILLERGGADANQSTTGPSGNAPLCLAAVQGHPGIVNSLLKHGAAIEETRNGITPLLWAIEKGNTEIARILLEAGADKETIAGMSNNCWQGLSTPLVSAAKLGRVEIVKVHLVLAHLHTTVRPPPSLIFCATHVPSNLYILDHLRHHSNIGPPKD
jgi:ankyrin repeat protein